MITYKLTQNNNKTIAASYQKWYATPVLGESIDMDGLAEHMGNHNTPYSLGTIKGVLSDMVTCIKELIMNGNTVRIDNLAIFSVGISSKKGCEKKSDFRVSEYVEGVHLNARATGELSYNKINLDATLKRSPLDKDDDSTGTGNGGGGDEEDLIGQVEDDLKIVEG
jgi:predicted histone-like DNA-binding protein